MQKIRYRTSKSQIQKSVKNKVVLITGGAGSLGSALTKKLIEYDVKQIRVLDVNEHSLFKLHRAIKDPRVTFLLGNILDKERIEMAMNDVDIVIHTAAVKNVEITEFNAIDTVDNNVNGTVNLIKSAMRLNPEKFLNISTDKVVETSTLYGTTKLLGEKLVSWAAEHTKNTKFSSVRFGNIIESKGNVFEVWEEELKKKQPLSITHQSMKRYFFHLDEAVDFILNCLAMMRQGQIFVPKMKLVKIKELASKISKKHRIIGLRPGEKLDEALLTKDEMKDAVEKKNMWIIQSPFYLNFRKSK